MTQKEKAEELYWKYYHHIEHYLDSGVDHKISKMCAKMEVGGRIETLVEYGQENMELQGMDGELRWLEGIIIEIEKL